MTTTQKALAMCLSRTILPVEVRTYISHINRITEQKEETRKKLSHVLDVVSGMGEFLDWIIKSNQGESLKKKEQLWREGMYHAMSGVVLVRVGWHRIRRVPAENTHEALVAWSKCWDMELVLSVESDSHGVLVFQTPEHEERTMAYIDIWRLFMYPSYHLEGVGAPALINSLFELPGLRQPERSRRTPELANVPSLPVGTLTISSFRNLYPPYYDDVH